jgi:hypothetical protein
MNVSAYNVFTGNPERKKRPGRFRRRDENNRKIHLRQSTRVWAGFIFHLPK